MLIAILAEVGRLLRPHMRWGRRKGTVSIEYALLLALLVVAGIAAWASLGDMLRTALTEVINSFNETAGS